jgi:hypothetical protein
MLGKPVENLLFGVLLLGVISLQFHHQQVHATVSEGTHSYITLYKPSISLVSITSHGLRIERDEIAFQSFLPSSSVCVIFARSCYICSYDFSAADFPRNLLPSSERGLLSLPKNLVQKFLCWNMCFFLSFKTKPSAARRWCSWDS